MKAIKAFVKSHLVLTYFALAFAISWCGVLIVVGPGGNEALRRRALRRSVIVAVSSAAT